MEGRQVELVVRGQFVKVMRAVEQDRVKELLLVHYKQEKCLFVCTEIKSLVEDRYLLTKIKFLTSNELSFNLFVMAMPLLPFP